jgi:hypothetical protein
MATNLTFEFYANFNTASIYVGYSALPSTIASGTIRYRHAGRDWIAGHGLVDLPRPVPPATSTPTLATSLFGLIPGEGVEVEITFLRHSTIDGTFLEKQTRGGTFTARSDSFVSSGNTRYLSVGGNDANSGLDRDNPWKTLKEASKKSALNPGDTILMLAGDYTFYDLTPRWNPGDALIDAANGSKSGTSSAYITLKPEVPGTVTIRGSKKINFTWTQEDVGGTYGKVYKSSGTVTERLNRMRFKSGSTNTILYPYMAKVNDVDPPPPEGPSENTKFGMAAHTWPGWFQDTDGTIYVKLNSGSSYGNAPQTDELTATPLNDNGINFYHVAYWKVEGITFEDFGIQEDDHRPKPRYGVEILGGDNIVIDGCTFRDSGAKVSYYFPNIASSKITFQDCRFEASGLWPICDNLTDSRAWEYGKNTPLNVPGIYMDTTRGAVIRRTTFDGVYYAITSSSNTSDLDIYNNVFVKIAGDTSLDNPSGEPAWEVKHTRIFLNEFLVQNTGVSASPFNVGPLFCIGNLHQEFRGAPYKFGNGNAARGYPSAAWKLLYHNTCKSTADKVGGGSYGFATNGAMGNVVAKNNIFQGAEPQIVSDLSQDPHTGPNAFIRNVFYSTSGSTPHQFIWRYKTYQKNPPTYLTIEQALMDPLTGEPARNPNEVVCFEMNVEELNPFPSGGDTALNVLLEGQAVAIPGITNIAGTATGVYLAEPLAIGRFGSFTMPPRVTSPTATLTRRLIPMLMQQQTPQPVG